MANFEAKKVDFSDIHGGQRYQNGDIVDAEAINAPIEAAAFAQSIATNQPNIENIGGGGVPTVAIEELPEGGVRFVFANLKGTDHSQQISALTDKISNIESQNIKQEGKISRNEKRITNIEQGLAADNFETDASVAYVKDVPENALPYAAIGKIGGMTMKTSTNLIPYPYPDLPESFNEVAITDNGDGSLTLNGTAPEWAEFEFATVTLQKGTYCLSGDSVTAITSLIGIRVYHSGNEDDYNSYEACGDESVSFHVASESVCKIYIVFDDASSIYFSNDTFCPMLNRGSTALPFEPYFEVLRSAPVTEIVSVGKNLFDDSILAELGFSKVSEHEYFHNQLYTLLGKKIFVNKYGIGGSFSISGKLQYVDVGSTSSGLLAQVYYTDGTKKDFSATNKKYGEYFDYSVTTDASKTVDYICFTFGSSSVHTYVKDWQIEIGSATEYTPYTVVGSLSIPEAVQTLDGYGEGNPNDATEYNYIDFDKKEFVKKGHIVDGEWVRDESVTDISDILTSDNLLQVEGGGTITMVNEHGLAVPSEVIYQLKGVAE